MPPRNIAFLFGAGASYDAGLPLLNELTEQVRERIGQAIPSLLAVFDQLRRHTDEFGRTERGNIEDILGRVDTLLASGRATRSPSRRDAALVGHEARKQIWDLLHHSPSAELGFLDPLVTLASRWGGLDIFSLNNDLVVEDWAQRRGISLVDGFAGGRIWRTDHYDSSRGLFRLIKLHGSLDWVVHPGRRIERFSGLFRERTGRVALRSPLPDLALIFPSEHKVVMHPALIELFSIFRRRTRTLDHLVVAGCGLHDEHIRALLLEALTVSPRLTLTVVDPAAPSVVANLLPRWRRADLLRQVHCLMMPLSQALGGPLDDLLASSVPAPADLLLRALALLPALPARPACEALVRRLEHLPAVTEPDRRDMLRVLDSHLPAAPVEGPFPARLFDLHKLLDSPTPPHPRDLAAPIRRLAAALDDPSAAPRLVHEEASELTCIAGHPSRLWSTVAGSKLVGPTLRAPAGLTVVGQYAYVTEKSAFRRVGLGRIRKIHLGTGRSSQLGLDARPLALALPASLRLLPYLRSTPRDNESRRAAKDRLRALGFLDWPTAIARLQGDHLVIVESRRASVVDLASQRVVRELPRDFMNLTSVAVLSATEVLLLESGITSHGQLLLWDLRTNVAATVTEPVSGGRSMAIDPSRKLLLMTVQQPGRHRGSIAAFQLSSPLGASSRRILFDGLDEPGAIQYLGAHRWLCATRTGLLRFSY